jgi:3-deoxy-manno-octulosonate cytidylyltransferase (CMP-KDO synthetase)
MAQLNPSAPEYTVVIPARFAATRLPGKPLADIAGVPMIVRVVERVRASGAAQVIVATDDQRVVAACEDAAVEVMLTLAEHPSGSDRIMEVAGRLGWSDEHVLINVQGDEPLIPAQVIDQLAARLAGDADLGVATLCTRIHDPAELFDPNAVKVVRDLTGTALYFSRAPIPYARDHFGGVLAQMPQRGSWWRHVGIYGFRVAALRRFVETPRAELEAIESLEQLRFLASGVPIHVDEACVPVPSGVDTPEDLARVGKQFSA